VPWRRDISQRQPLTELRPTPLGTRPPEIAGGLKREITAGLADPKMKARLADLGASLLAGSPADFGKLIAAETEKWGKVIKLAGIKPD
jgi:tripartite-type tricarboxylate transporter receptor subunit TctC